MTEHAPKPNQIDVAKPNEANNAIMGQFTAVEQTPDKQGNPRLWGVDDEGKKHRIGEQALFENYNWGGSVTPAGVPENLTEMNDAELRGIAVQKAGEAARLRAAGDEKAAARAQDFSRIAANTLKTRGAQTPAEITPVGTLAEAPKTRRERLASALKERKMAWVEARRTDLPLNRNSLAHKAGRLVGKTKRLAVGNNSLYARAINKGMNAGEKFFNNMEANAKESQAVEAVVVEEPQELIVKPVEYKRNGKAIKFNRYYTKSEQGKHTPVKKANATVAMGNLFQAITPSVQSEKNAEPDNIDSLMAEIRQEKAKVEELVGAKKTEEAKQVFGRLAEGFMALAIASGSTKEEALLLKEKAISEINELEASLFRGDATEPVIDASETGLAKRRKNILTRAKEYFGSISKDSKEISIKARQRIAGAVIGLMVVSGLGSLQFLSDKDNAENEFAGTRDKTEQVEGSTSTALPSDEAGGRVTTEPEIKGAVNQATISQEQAVNISEQLSPGDTIWAHAEQQLIREGNPDPTNAQILENTQRILDENGISWEEARRLPIGFQFKV